MTWKLRGSLVLALTIIVVWWWNNTGTSTRLVTAKGAGASVAAAVRAADNGFSSLAASEWSAARTACANVASRDMIGIVSWNVLAHEYTHHNTAIRKVETKQQQSYRYTAIHEVIALAADLHPDLTEKEKEEEKDKKDKAKAKEKEVARARQRRSAADFDVAEPTVDLFLLQEVTPAFMDYLMSDDREPALAANFDMRFAKRAASGNVADGGAVLWNTQRFTLQLWQPIYFATGLTTQPRMAAVAVLHESQANRTVIAVSVHLESNRSRAYNRKGQMDELAVALYAIVKDVRRTTGTEPVLALSGDLNHDISTLDSISGALTGTTTTSSSSSSSTPSRSLALRSMTTPSLTTAHETLDHLFVSRNIGTAVRVYPPAISRDRRLVFWPSDHIALLATLCIH